VTSIATESHAGKASGWSVVGSRATAIENNTYQETPTISASWPEIC
jgi:hypothetical protein